MGTTGHASPEDAPRVKQPQRGERAALFLILAGARNFARRLLLRAPMSLRSLRRAPLLGRLLHRLSYRLVPLGAYVWAQVQNGPAQGIWLELNPRTG